MNIQKKKIIADKRVSNTEPPAFDTSVGCEVLVVQPATASTENSLDRRRLVIFICS